MGFGHIRQSLPVGEHMIRRGILGCQHRRWVLEGCSQDFFRGHPNMRPGQPILSCPPGELTKGGGHFTNPSLIIGNIPGWPPLVPDFSSEDRCTVTGADHLFRLLRSLHGVAGGTIMLGMEKYSAGLAGDERRLGKIIVHCARYGQQDQLALPHTHKSG